MVTNDFNFDSEIVIVPEGVELIDYDFIKQFINIRKIILPSTLRYIDNETFKNCTTLEEIDIPESIEQIGYEAFSGCTSLKRINLPNKYFYIQPYAFSNCTSLTQFTLPSDITYFSEGLLSGCINLEKINCSDKITYIDDYALYNCHKLKDFKISKYTSHIGEFAMFGCESITKIAIPKCTYSIGYAAFGMMKSLRKIMVDSGNERYKNAHNMLIDKENQTILQYAIASEEENVSISMFYNDPIHDADDEEFQLMSRAESIADYAFAGAKNIKSIDAFSSLGTIGMHTFLGCDNLERFNFVFYDFGEDISVPIATFGADKDKVFVPFKKIYIDNGVTVIGGRNNTFFQNAEYVFLPVTLKEIHYGAFSLSDKLKTLRIPRYIRIICPNSFNENTKISLPFLRDEIDSKDLFFMVSTHGDDYHNKMDINFCVMRDGTYYIKANDEMYFKIKTNKNYYDTELSKVMQLREEILYSPFSISYDLVDMLDLNLDSIYKICRKSLNEDISNDDLSAVLEQNPYMDSIEAKSYSPLVRKIIKEYGIEDENFLNIFLDFNFPLRDIHEYCMNYSKTMSMMFKYGDILNYCTKFYFGPEYIIDYCKLLDKYNIKDKMLYNPAIFIQLSEKEMELFLSKYNKNIRHILINSDAFDDIGYKFKSIFYVLKCTGAFSDDKVFNQKVQTFINEKVFGKDSKFRISGNDIKDSFDGFDDRDEVDYEFSEFFMNNYEELFNLNSEYPGIISEIYNAFPRLMERSTSNKGSQRQLKVTVKDCISYLLLSSDNESIEDKEKLQIFLNDYFPEYKDVANEALKIVNESINAPRNIFTNSNDADEDLCEDIGSNDFTYDWLPKQSWDNLILGKRCSCCAHVIGAGAGITRASMVRDDCQNLVIRNKKGEIVAKMTFYVNKEKGYGVFNTAEVNIKYRDDEVIRKIYEAFIRGCNAFIEEYNKNNSISLDLITMGEYRNVIKYELGNIETDILDTPDYSDYAHYRSYIGDDGEHHRVVGQYGGDSKEGQILVYSKKGGINNGN